ncbi:GPI inositol-deacylase PGAP1-like [Plasmopara halstedii]|uniref:GPI inositol-deacylase PGAP1-like n=1 Tax=Plasmopara halstedii TaxID=4781 RepID=A0A0P1AGS3_PLAHL|nr:GPI inositol-deacylase PGAP1-like [Plasmopara halstedii]CEG39844.1 GPI inositol-deacylase PGAP1-like [Plasmopara halstedii]|eukprot:XP_024576213.1 GPI inositol-deacylase PGAP1-like [Plasmopara halstedii]
MKGFVRAVWRGIVLASFAEFVSASRQLETLLSNLPSLKLHFTLHRKGFEISDDAVFIGHANPVVSDDGLTVLYDGYATSVRGQFQTTYSLVNGSAYVITNDNLNVTTRCLSPSDLPLYTILPAINAMKSISATRLPSGCKSTFETSFDGVQYEICQESEKFTATSRDVTIEVSYVQDRDHIPVLETGLICDSIAKATALTPTALALLQGNPPPVRRRRMLEEESPVAKFPKRCTCHSIPRPCIFFHGLGNEMDEPGVQNSSRHFGSDVIKRHAPCCTTIKYASLNTVDYGWTSLNLQSKACDRALSMSKTSSKRRRQIQDTIIVTHSMGGLMIAGALANGVCHLDSSSTWISLSPPMKGSMSSDYLIDFCHGKVHNFMSRILLKGKCPIPESTISVAYQYGEHSNYMLDAAYSAAQQVYQQHVYAAMCSSSSVGNISKYQAKYIMGGRIFPHKSSKNDGLVEFDSCAGGISPQRFGKTPDSRFYKCELNHADTAFKTGNGIFKSTVLPLTWFECLL